MRQIEICHASPGIDASFRVLISVQYDIQQHVQRDSKVYLGRLGPMRSSIRNNLSGLRHRSDDKRDAARLKARVDDYSERFHVRHIPSSRTFCLINVDRSGEGRY